MNKGKRMDEKVQCDEQPITPMTTAQRKVVELIDAGLSVKLAAEKLGIPEGTARWRLRRAGRIEGICSAL